jgi:hypothetical protein
MKSYPHDCDADSEQEMNEAAEKQAHDEGDCQNHPGFCQYCHDEFEAKNEDEEYERSKPVCQDCGEKALPGYVAGDRCERLRKRNACVPATVCGGRLDEP